MQENIITFLTRQIYNFKSGHIYINLILIYLQLKNNTKFTVDLTFVR